MSRKSKKYNKDLGFFTVRVMAEYGASGLWLTNPFRYTEISCEELRLPESLQSRFAAWIDAYEVHLSVKSFDYDNFNQTGRDLAQALKEHLGSESYVEFVPEVEDDDVIVVEPEVIE